MIEGFLISVAFFFLMSLIIFNGIMFALKPKEWAANRWSLYDKNRLYLLDSPISAFMLRVVGAFFVLMGSSGLATLTARLFNSDRARVISGALASPADWIQPAMGPLLIISGLYTAIRPSSFMNAKTIENVAFLRAGARVLGLFLAVCGCVFTVNTFGWPISGGTRALSILLVVALGPFLAYLFVNGVMYMWNPVGWSASKFSFVLPSEYRRDITSGDGMRARSVGLLLMLVSVVMLWSLTYFI